MIVTGYRAMRTPKDENMAIIRKDPEWVEIAKENMRKAEQIIASRFLEIGGGELALVSAEDFDRVSRFRWTVTDCSRHGTKKLYARRSVWEERRTLRGVVKVRRRTQYLHRFIMGEPVGKVIDHLNGDGLDCRRQNLKVCSQSENAAYCRQRRPA